MTIHTLNDAFERGLADMCNAEKQISEALPKMMDGCNSPELCDLIEAHLNETEDQIQKLERIAKLCNIKLQQGTCGAIKGILEEGAKIINSIEKGAVRDAVLIANAQKVEHFEIATYGTLACVARKLGNYEAVELLEEILDQEKTADEKLTRLAEQNINDEALAMAA
jgi:ferritin-like metal-binding protein YciE